MQYAFGQMPEVDLSKIPRRKRRFFRNRKLLLKALSKHVQKVQDVREIEKQKIIQELKYRLERAERAELLSLADKLFEELSSDQAEDIIVSNIKAKKRHAEELTKKDYEEIAENIYMQLREAREAEKLKHREKKVREKEIERIKERLATLQGLKKKPEMKPGKKQKRGKERAAMLGEIEEAGDEEILSALAAEPELGSEGEEEQSIFKELEELSEEGKKKKK
ncbi:MAG: hypothetical protein J7L44_02360 [Candidatus Diapherotrites archaeon]|nr:hypothetical protein [Candidatus Diapherotrites archaeon]